MPSTLRRTINDINRDIPNGLSKRPQDEEIEQIYLGRIQPLSLTFRDSMKFSIRMKLMAGFSAALPMMVIMGAMSFNSTVDLVDASNKVDHSHQVIRGLDLIESRLKDAETGQRGFVITGEDQYLEPFNVGIAELELELKNVRALTLDNPFQQRKLDIIEPLIQLRLKQLSETIILRRNAGFESARRVIARSDSGKQVMDELRSQVAIMQDEESRLHEQQKVDTASTSFTAKFTTFAGTITSFFILAIVAFFLSRNISIPVAKLGAAAANIGQGDLETRVDVSSGDELGELGLSFNKMAEGLQQATARLEEGNRKLTQEVSERKRAEEEISSLARFPSENPGPIIRIAGDGTILYSNAAGQNLLPCQYSEVGRTTSEDWCKITADGLASGTETSVEVHWGKRDFSFAVVPIVDSGYVNLYGRDITSRKRAEEELKILAANLEVSNRDLQDFASVASHDLQEPLRKILAFGDRLRSKCSDTLSEQGQDYLQRMMDAAQRMRDLIDDLLTLSRVSSQGNSNVPVDLAAVVEQVISDLEVAIEQSGGRIEVGELPTIDAGPTQMRQLLQNLISNALKFHKPDEPIVVKVKSRILDDYILDDDRDDAVGAGVAKMVELTVEDTGIGFDETYSDRIFKVFQRLHGRDQYSGTGLGLAVCRKIAERHNGTITAKSKPGQGAKFIVTLPWNHTEGESTLWNNTASLLRS